MFDDFTNGEVSKGTVVWFNDTRGYGFIKTYDNREIFVHFSSIVGEGYRTLTEGQKVEFQIIKTDRGISASKVIKES
ncbi:cold shock domain-containing protein [Paenibacillus sp. Marseille-P2973]|uniref:cold-shock protein n=1 Tax=Paenibacillus sp. Marseille-P2973 TaxID=1871032 RepID=UPI0032B471B0